MSRSSETRVVLAGKIRAGIAGRTGGRAGGRPIGTASHSVQVQDSLRCVQAHTAKELAQAQRFWMNRYREAGLGGIDEKTPGFESLRLPTVPGINGHASAPITNWRSTTFVAYCLADPRRSRQTKHHYQLNRLGLELEALEQICGTVTLLSPQDQHLGSPQAGEASIGRITHLAVDHTPLESGITAAGYRTVFLEMTSCMHRAAIRMGLAHLDAIVHPRHAKLYRRVFGAIPIGEPFACEQVGGSPGQYMRADITQPSHFHARLRDRYATKITS